MSGNTNLDNISILEFQRKFQSGEEGLIKKFYCAHRDAFVRWSMREYQSSLEACRDAYQEAMIGLVQVLRKGRIVDDHATAKSYLFTLGKNKLIDARRKLKQEMTLEDPHRYQLGEDAFEVDEELLGRLRTSLTKIKANCRGIIHKYYFDRWDMQSIAREYNLANANSAKTQKRKCMKALIKVYQESNR